LSAQDALSAQEPRPGRTCGHPASKETTHIAKNVKDELHAPMNPLHMPLLIFLTSSLEFVTLMPRPLLASADYTHDTSFRTKQLCVVRGRLLAKNFNLVCLMQCKGGSKLSTGLV